MAAPPYSSSTVTPSSPRSPSLRHRSIGKALLRSISAARGAISPAAKLLHRLAQHVQGFPEAEIQAGKAGKHLGVGRVHGRLPNEGGWNAQS